jgi:hypothetical protein
MVGISGRGKVVGKEGRRVITVQKCVHMHVIGIKVPVLTIP